MRIFFLPVTTQRSLIYCQKLEAPLVKAKPRLDDRLASKAAKVWDGFEKSDKKWKQAVVRWTGKLLDTIPFEEGGLKTVPPQHTMMRRLRNKTHISEKEAFKTGVAHELEPIELVYPSTAYLGQSSSKSATPKSGTPESVTEIPRSATEIPRSAAEISRSATSRSETPRSANSGSANPMSFAEAQTKVGRIAAAALKTHRKQMVWCVAGLPLTIPFAINPFFPNIPGFYLLYRLWSNYRAYKSAQHLQLLIQNKQFVGKTLPELDAAYKDIPIPMSAPLATKIDNIIGDRTVHRELQQVLRQTSPLLPKNKNHPA